MPTPDHDYAKPDIVTPHDPARRQFMLASALGAMASLLGCGSGGGDAPALPGTPLSPPVKLADLNPSLQVDLDPARLPFAMPAAATLAANAKKVFAHWFPPYPRSIDNAPPEADYWARNWLSATPQDSWEAHHAPYGGFHRERPAPRAPLTGDWKYADLVDDCRQAKAAGLDGFTVDVLTIWKQGTPVQADNQTQWERILRLWDAADAEGIKLIPMPDFEAHFKTNPDDVVWLVQQLASKPASYRLGDGRLVLTA